MEKRDPDEDEKQYIAPYSKEELDFINNYVDVAGNQNPSMGRRIIRQRRKDAEVPIKDQFREVLDREPTQAELDYLRRFLQIEDMDPYEIGQYLKGLPEHQLSALNTDTEAYEKKLTEGDLATVQRGADIAGAQAQ